MPIDLISTDSPPAAGTLQVAGRVGTRNAAAEQTLAGRKSVTDNGSFAETQTTPPPVPQVPGYEVLERLGQGNMGTVYRAREIKLNRFVALKFIALGPQPKPEDVLRFQIEAESLASLQHANVVQVYEAGSHDGQLYLAMELVQGQTLEAYLEEHRLAPREAATLAMSLAQAVQALHARGIVHRDLKPANILLAEGNVPKLADFGLAKRLETDSLVTRDGMIVGTPCYMAPEQAEGNSRKVGTGADVFSLGVIIYEMLAGQKPFVGTTILGTLALIRFEEPVPPNTLVKHLPRDLETICLKCLQKDPIKRYASAGELAADLQRYLRGEPVIARPLTHLQRAAKWCRRHPAVSASGSLIAAGVLAAAVGGVWHNYEIRRERDATQEYFQLSREAVEVLLTEVADEQIATTPHLKQKREAILETALEFYQQLGERHEYHEAEPEHHAVAKVRAGDCLRWLARYDDSLQSYQHAIELLTKAAEKAIETEVAQHHLADAFSGVGELHLRTGQLAAAENSLQSALALNKQLAGSYPQNSGYLADLARNHNSLAVCFDGFGLLEQARHHLGVAVELLESIVIRENMHHAHVQDLAQTHLTLGSVLRKLEEHDKVEAAYLRSLELFEHLHEQHPDNVAYHFQYAQTANDLGHHCQDHGKVDSAAKYFAQAHAELQELKQKQTFLSHD